MNFEFRSILTPLAGNNSDQRSVAVRVMGKIDATPAQLGALANRYDIFKSQARLSLAGFLTVDGTLPDGSAYRFISNSGMDVAVIWPAGDINPGGPLDLPHGFGVRSNWHAPVIYRWKPSDNTWSLGHSPPQLATEPRSHNLVERLPASDGLPDVILPMVRAGVLVWDYAPHTAVAPAGTYVIPVNTQYTEIGHTLFGAHKTHFAVDSVIAGADGNALYTLAPMAAITPGASPEPVTPLPGGTDANGNETMLQAYRKVQPVPTLPQWKYRFWSERLTRSGALAYTLLQRQETSITTPIGAAQTSASTTTADVGALDPGTVFAVSYTNSHGGVLNNGDHVSFDSARNAFDFTGNITANNGTNQQTTYTATPPVVMPKVLALPGATAIEYADLHIDINLPGSVQWIGGTKRASFNPGTTFATGVPWYGISSATCTRFKSAVSRTGAPQVSLDVGWTSIVLLTGNIAGTLTGDLSTNANSNNNSGTSLFAKYMVPDHDPGLNGDAAMAWVLAEPNLHDGAVAEFSAAPPTGTTTITNSDTPCNNTGSYTLTTRAILDYDHRARFYVALRVEVSCTGARWAQVAGQYRGDIGKVSDPTYDVKIYAEWNWNGVTGQRLLVHSNAVKPAYEFTNVPVYNIYRFPNDDTLFPMSYNLPPVPALDEKFMASIERIGVHRGVNTNMAACDVRADLPASMQSAVGEEFSHAIGAMEVGHTATAQGQLYARTFSLNDVSTALWLLLQYGFDAKQNKGTTGPSWFYFPEIAAAMTQRFHLEVRNAVDVQWSDDLPGTTANPQPAPTNRVLKLYSV